MSKAVQGPSLVSPWPEFARLVCWTPARRMHAPGSRKTKHHEPIRGLPANIDKLDTTVFRRFGIGPIQELLFAKANRLDPRRTDPERVD